MLYTIDFGPLYCGTWRAGVGLPLSAGAWEVPNSVIVPEAIRPETFMVLRWDDTL